MSDGHCDVGFQAGLGAVAQREPEDRAALLEELSTCRRYAVALAAENLALKEEVALLKAIAESLLSERLQPADVGS